MRLFKIYGIWPQTNIHTTSVNAVTLVWGSLRLAPIKVNSLTSYKERNTSKVNRHLGDNLSVAA